MSLDPGSRVGPYEVIGSLGAGGMGEVYRARDTRLKRDVALKVLPETFAADAERLALSPRSARPRRAQSPEHRGHLRVGGVGGRGVRLQPERARARPRTRRRRTLADRIARGRIPLDEALPIARQIEALEAAHEQGFIHRDLKPGNIKLRPDGTVKVLDFGLAKALESEPAVAAIQAVALIPARAMVSAACESCVTSGRSRAATCGAIARSGGLRPRRMCRRKAARGRRSSRATWVDPSIGCSRLRLTRSERPARAGPITPAPRYPQDPSVAPSPACWQ